MGLFNFGPNIEIGQGVWWIISACIALITGTITKIMTKNHISRKEADKDFQTTKMCDERSGNIERELKEIKADQKVMGQDIKLILRNGQR